MLRCLLGMNLKTEPRTAAPLSLSAELAVSLAAALEGLAGLVAAIVVVVGPVGPAVVDGARAPLGRGRGPPVLLLPLDMTTID